MNDNPEIFPDAIIENVLEKILDYGKKHKLRNEDLAIKLFKQLDPKKKVNIEFVDLYDGLKAIGLDLTVQEEATLIKKFDKSGEFKLNLDELYKALFICKR